MALQTFLKTIQAHENLSEDQMVDAVTQIMDGQCSDAEIAAFLMGLSVRGETVSEITGAARVMCSKATSIKAPSDAVDCCGTGGDHSGSYNISTAVALVSAACGVPMAKHGNRSASSKSGAADVLEALGVNLDISHSVCEQALEDIGFAFLMAPKHHQAMKYVVPVRKALGVRTIFNLLGPLANPAGTKRQLIGVFDRKWMIPMAETLQKLGTEKAWIVHGSDGMDEITTTGETFVAKLEDDNITEVVLTPDDFDVMYSAPESLKGGDARTNAAALTALLEGIENAYRDIVVANTAAVLVIADKADNLKDAAKLAAAAIDSGKALDILSSYRNISQSGGEG